MCPTDAALRALERRVLALVPDDPARAVATGDLLSHLRVSDRTVYRALRRLEQRGAVVVRRVPMSRPGRNGHRYTLLVQCCHRTPLGAQLALDDEPAACAPSAPIVAPSAPALRDDDPLLDPHNTTVGAVTFRLAMQACGLTTLRALTDLPPARRRQFEAIWTRAMYDACAAAGTPIPRDRPSRADRTP